MYALVTSRYGPPGELRLEEIDRPEPDDDGVLVRVLAAAVNPYDWHVQRGVPYLVRTSTGLRRPKRPVPGVDMAGRVEAVGANVTELRPGDEVFGWGRHGALAEYERGEPRTCARKPAALSFEQAAAIPTAGCTALQALRDRGALQPGQRVLVVGAAGGVGTFAVQIAKALGATVTGVCSTRNVELVRSLGADRVVDYCADDFTRDGSRHDLILDLVGDRPLSHLRRVLTPKGTLVLVAGPEGRWVAPFAPVLKALVVSPFTGQRLLPFLARLRREDLTLLAELADAGELTPVVDRTYALRDAPDALRLLETGHARGKLVIIP